MAVALIAAALLAPLAEPVPVERRLMPTAFDRVRIDGPFVVTIASAAAPAARITGTAASLDRVRVRVDGTTLTIVPVRAAPGTPIDGAALPTIALAAPRIAAVSVRGGARVAVERMASPRVDLSLTGDGSIEVAATDADAVQAIVVGAGRLRIAGTSRQARFTVNGAAQVDAAALIADDLNVVSTGTGHGRYHARYGADVGADGSGSVVVTGNPQCRTRGRATIRCGDRPRSDQAATGSSAG